MFHSFIIIKFQNTYCKCNIFYLHIATYNQHIILPYMILAHT